MSLRNGHRVIFCFTIYFHFFVHEQWTRLRWLISHVTFQCNAIHSHSHSHKTRLRFRCPSHSIIAFCIDAPLWQIEFECKSIFTISAFNLTTKQRFLVEFSVLQCCNVYRVLQLAFYWLFLCVCVFVHEWEIRNMQFHCRNCMKSIFFFFIC